MKLNMGNFCSRPSDLEMANKELVSITVNNTSIKIVHGYIVNERADILGKVYSANPTNAELKLSTMLGKDIQRYAGKSVIQECNQYLDANGPVPVGTIVHTSGGSLSSRYLFHFVTPLYFDGNREENEQLFKVITCIMEDAENLGCKSISLPTVSDNLFGFPEEKCAEVYISSVVQYLVGNLNSPLTDIIIVSNKKQSVKFIQCDKFVKILTEYMKSN
jgi:putative ATPase